jgi:hypothetical protein
MANEDDIRQIFEFQQVDDIHDMRVKIYLMTQKMRAFPETGERWAVNFMTRNPQQRHELLPAPSSVPSTGN